MELNSVHGQRAMCKTHDQPIICFRGYGKLAGQVRAIDNQGVIACRLERPVDAAKDALAPMPDYGKLAVHGDRSAHDCASERLTYGLMPQTDAEDRNCRCRRSYERK